MSPHIIDGCTGPTCHNATFGDCPCSCHDSPDDTGNDDPPNLPEFSDVIDDEAPWWDEDMGYK